MFRFLDSYRSKIPCNCIWKDGIEFAFQIVENLGTLIEYENINDFAGKSIQEIHDAKLEMLEDIRKCDISITNEYDVKKLLN